MGLSEYNRKRNFAVTSEPPGDSPAHPRQEAAREFVIQKHAASHLHYDFRLELDGVLLSWSVPKGPSLDPKVKRLAMHVEDHPLAYADFEGIIPKGQYGGGTVMLWDRGTWEPEGDPRKGYAAGNLKFRLKGEKLHGGFALVKLRGRPPARAKDARWRGQGDERSWLLVKEKDAEVRDAASGEITETETTSVATGRSMEEIAADRSRVWHSKPAHIDPSGTAGAREAPMPARLHPPRPAAAKAPPDGDDWLHEMAIDGVRVIARSARGEVRFLSEKGKPLAGAAARAAAAFEDGVRMLPAETLIVEGVVTPPAPGSAGDAAGYFLSDLIYLDGHDLTRARLDARKELLAELVRRAPERNAIRVLEHIAGNGPAFHREACRLGIPAMLSRRADSPYGARAGWRRIECPKDAKVGKTSRKASGKAPSKPAAKPAKTPAKPPALAPTAIKLTTPERVLWPDVAGGFTKADLAAYYQSIARFVVPHVSGRPLSLFRCPEGMPDKPGVKPACFFMKHFGSAAPKQLDRVPIQEKTKTNDYLVARDLDGVIALVQMSILELHLWNARADAVEAPDQVIFDLDPDPAVPWARVVEAAFELRRRLAALDLDSFVKTTGGKGLHVTVPFARGRRAEISWDDAFTFSLAVAQSLEREQPRGFVTTMSKAKRVGKIFIDCFRNQRGNTAVAPYSTRARPGAPVALPIEWDELSADLDPLTFTVQTVPPRLAAQKTDPWAAALTTKQHLTTTLRKHAAG